MKKVNLVQDYFCNDLHSVKTFCCDYQGYNGLKQKVTENLRTLSR